MNIFVNLSCKYKSYTYHKGMYDHRQKKDFSWILHDQKLMLDHYICMGKFAI
jgi:hypothetical protein